MLKNKKGDVGDFAVFLSVIFVIGLTFFMGTMLWNNVVSPIQNKTQSMIDDPIVEQKLNESFQDIQNSFNMFDIIFAIFVFGFYIVLLMSVFYLDTHPAFFVFALLALIVIFVLAGVLSDVWVNVEGEGNQALADSGLEQVDEFPIMSHIFSNLMSYLIVMSSLFLIILYASKRVAG